MRKIVFQMMTTLNGRLESRICHGFGFPVPALALDGMQVANQVALLYFGCAWIAFRAALTSFVSPFPSSWGWCSASRSSRSCA
jgi:hypothetical protein